MQEAGDARLLLVGATGFALVSAVAAFVPTAGALIAARVGARVEAPLSVSESDILDGLVLDLLADSGRLG